MPTIAPILGGIGALAGGIGSLFGSSNTPKAATKTLPNQKQAANSVLSTNAGLSNIPMELMPQYQALTTSLQNNPYATQAVQGSQQASQYGMNAAGGAAQASSNLGGLADSLMPYLSQLGAAAFDPQQDLYNRTLHDTQQQQRVGQSARGITMSPYGAGLENDALKNFNIDWQNQQLGRMTQGAGGLAQLLGSIGQGYSGAAGLGEGAMNLANTAGGLPYGTTQGIGQNNLGWLNAMSQAGQNANAVPQQQIQNLLQYLQAGNSSNQTATQAAGQQWGQNQQLGSGLGTALSSFAPGGQNTNFFSTLANLFNPQQASYGLPQ